MAWAERQSQLLLGIRYQNAAYQDWSLKVANQEEKNAVINGQVSDLFRVPVDIWHVIPPEVRMVMVSNNPRWGGDNTPEVRRNLDIVEACSGVARIARWGELGGMRVAAIDREYGPHMDMTTAEGMALATLLLLRVRVGGLFFNACQCSTWVWIGRAQTKRSKECIMGDSEKQSVQEANVLNKYSAVLAHIAWLLGVTWVIEQPASSLFWETPDMRNVLALTAAGRVHFPMSNFGHEMPKPTVLRGTARWFHNLHPPTPLLPIKKKPAARIQKKPAAYVTTKTIDKDGHVKRQVTGRCKALKASQVYPVKFALAVVRLQFPECKMLQGLTA